MKNVVIDLTKVEAFMEKDISRLVVDTYSDQIGVFKTLIPVSVRASEISAEGSSIYQYDPRGKAAVA